MPVRCSGIGSVRKRLAKPVGLQSKDRQLAQAAEPLRSRMRRKKRRVIRGHRHASGTTIHEVGRIWDDVAARTSTEEAPLGTAARATGFIFTHGSKNTCWARDDRTVHLPSVPRNAWGSRGLLADGDGQAVFFDQRLDRERHHHDVREYLDGTVASVRFDLPTARASPTPQRPDVLRLLTADSLAAVFEG